MFNQNIISNKIDLNLSTTLSSYNNKYNVTLSIIAVFYAECGKLGLDAECRGAINSIEK
jgi:hypothetical protein